MSTTPIIQFGTSRFLQAHVDLFVSEALQHGDAAGHITVVQSSGDPSRSARLAALANPAGFEVRIRGLHNGELVDRSVSVKSVARALCLPRDLETVTKIMSTEARIVLSNTSDAGFRSQAEDRALEFSTGMSYPAKLTWLLFKRFSAGGEPIQIMPAELVPDNGDTLRDLVLSIARLYPEDFQVWLRDRVLWINSLVDRIVSEPIEPAGAIAEPYALWAIENQPGFLPPCSHPDVKVVSDLKEFETLKLYILNLGHTYIVSRWRRMADGKTQFVRDYLMDEGNLSDLRDLYREEVIPAFGAQGCGEAAEAYVASTIDRFRNPYLDHRLSDIAQNHAEKVERRIGTFLDFARKADPSLQIPRLETLVHQTRKAEAP